MGFIASFIESTMVLLSGSTEHRKIAQMPALTRTTIDQANKAVQTAVFMQVASYNSNNIITNNVLKQAPQLLFEVYYAFLIHVAHASTTVGRENVF